MNNYPNFKNFNYSDIKNYNDMNAYENMNETYDNKNNLYTPYDGLIRGNLFKNLYSPYKKNEPFEIKPMNEQAELLTYIDALGFAMIDLNLYLDIYPNDKNAINLFNQYRKENENITNEYEEKYGPLTLNSNSLNSTPWSWDDMPWPWDN